MNAIYFLLGLGCIIAIVLPFRIFASETSGRWVVYYSNHAEPSAFDPYHLVVLDSNSSHYISPLHEKGKLICGYLSIGEVANSREYFEDVKQEGILLNENPNWPGSFYVDLRNPLWKKRVLEELIPMILQKRFDGLFLDTLDSPPHLEREDPIKYSGMREATIELIKAVRKHYPNTKIIMNRGFDLVDAVGGNIDYILGESIYTTYDFKQKKYLKQPMNIYDIQLKALQQAQKEYPNLKVLTLDYWNPDDTEEIKKIYSVERDNGFMPYVSTIDLESIVPEPR